MNQKSRHLAKTKARLSREYDAEINKYTALAKDLKGQSTKVPVETKQAKKAK